MAFNGRVKEPPHKTDLAFSEATTGVMDPFDIASALLSIREYEETERERDENGDCSFQLPRYGPNYQTAFSGAVALMADFNYDGVFEKVLSGNQLLGSTLMVSISGELLLQRIAQAREEIEAFLGSFARDVRDNYSSGYRFEVDTSRVGKTKIQGVYRCYDSILNYLHGLAETLDPELKYTLPASELGLLKALPGRLSDELTQKDNKATREAAATLSEVCRDERRHRETIKNMERGGRSSRVVAVFGGGKGREGHEGSILGPGMGQGGSFESILGPGLPG